MNKSIATTLGPIVLGVWFVMSCANQRRPPGGPVDRTAPEILQTEPESGAISVARAQIITIQFSEPMKRLEVERSLHLFPAPDAPPEIRWKGNRLSIRPDTLWDINQTYVVTLQGDTRDAHGNALDKSFQMAFSTGDRIDSGRVLGRIFRNGRPVRGATALCYRLDDLHANPEFDTAAYVVLTDSSGAFAFTYLTSGAYRVYGLDDRDGDWLWNVGTEWIGVPSEQPVVTSAEWNAYLSPLHLVHIDTIALEVTAALMMSDRLVRIELSRPVDSLVVMSHCAISLIGETGRTGQARELYVPDSLTRFVYALFDSIGVDERTVEVEWSGPATSRSEIELSAPDPTRPPDDRWLLKINPDTSLRMSFLPLTLNLQFAIPLDSSRPLRIRLLGSADTIWLHSKLVHPFLVQATLPGKDLWDGPVDVEILSGAVLSTSGYSWPADSSVRFPLNAPFADSSGGIEVHLDSLITPPSAVFRMSLVPITRAGAPFWTIFDDDGSALGELAEGDYAIRLLLDRDGDLRFDPGWPHPFRSSESLWLIPDTLRVRARFTTELQLGTLPR